MTTPAAEHAETRQALSLSDLPSVDRLLAMPFALLAVNQHGRTLVKRAIVHSLDEVRARLAQVSGPPETLAQLHAAIVSRIATDTTPGLRPVFNLTGTVIHTNLGRSPLPEAAIRALVQAARHPVTIEYDLALGQRGERDSITESLLAELTGAEAATVVNNNAAAVLLSLGALAHRKQVLVSRGELVEIGGSFRIPDIMKSAGCKLVEVGTTNRTHLRDYAGALTDKAALLARIHTSNYVITGFTASPSEAELATLAHAHGLPLMVDMGSGALIPFERYRLPHEPMPQESLAAGADVVTFSGDKLLGGPQCGIIVGKRDLIAKIRRHPLKRALRCDKLIVGALEAVLRVYRDHLDDSRALAQQIPVLRLLSRPAADIALAGQRLLGPVALALRDLATVAVQAALSQIGSGSLPVERLDTWALVLTPLGKRSGRSVSALETAFRALPMPVIGRIKEGALWLDLRTLDDESGFLRQLALLTGAAVR